MTRLIHPSMWKPSKDIHPEPQADLAIRSLQNEVVLAGPGAGKTELLAQRAAFLLQTGACRTPMHILAISFKKDAAQNLRNRLIQRCGNQVAYRFDSMTFDAFAKGLVDRFLCSIPAEFRPTPDYTIKTAMTDTNIRDIVGTFVPPENFGSNVEVANIAIESLRHMLTEVPASAMLDVASLKDWVGRRFWAYLLREGKQSVLTFDMIRALAIVLLQRNPLILKALRGTYSHVFLDEFQDTTESQYSLMKTAFHGSAATMTAVGDINQRIMVWAGAVHDIFERFINDFKATTRSLVMNHRSSPGLIAIQKQIVCALEGDNVAPLAGGIDVSEACQIIQFNSETDEAQWIASYVQEVTQPKGLQPRDICILAKQRPDKYTNSLLSLMSERGIAARIEQEYQDLLSEPVTNSLVGVLKLATRERSPRYWRETIDNLNILRFGSTDETENGIVASEVTAFLRTWKLELTKCDSESELSLCLRSAIEYIGRKELRQAYSQYRQGTFLDDVCSTIAWLVWQSYEKTHEWGKAVDDFVGETAVPVMTIHKSKGLEYNTIIFVGLEDGAFWSFDKQQHEDMCSFFVAFSRAKERVIFTYCCQRDTGWGAQAQSRRKIQTLYDILHLSGIKPVTA